MKIAGKEITLSFKMAQIKAVQEHMGVSEFSDIPVVFGEVAKDPIKMAEMAVACVYYGSGAFESIGEIENQIESAEEVFPAFSEFIAAFNKFYGIKSDGSGEAEAP